MKNEYPELLYYFTVNAQFIFVSDWLSDSEMANSFYTHR